MSGLRDVGAVTSSKTPVFVLLEATHLARITSRSPPVMVSRDAPNVQSSHVLEIATGIDIVQDYSHRHGQGVCVLSWNGTVASVTIRQPQNAAAAAGRGSGGVVTLHGRFEFLSLTGMALPPPSSQSASGLLIFLAGGQVQVVGGSVAGPLLASGPVMLMSASFANAAYDRLPLDRDGEEVVEESPTITISQCSGVGDW